MVAMLLAGCASTSTNFPDLSKTSLREIQFRVARNLNKLKSFEGRGRVIIEMPGEGYSGTAKIFINFPDSIFIKTEAILGIDIGAMFIDSRVFGAYAPRENVLYYGQTPQLDLKDFLQVEIETDELVEDLTGLTQVPVDSSTTLAMDGDEFLLVSRREGGLLRHWVDAEKHVVTRSELLDATGDVILEKEFRRFGRKKGVHLPQIVKVTRPKARERLTVYYTGQTVNEPIADENFRLKTAKNAKRVFWGANRQRFKKANPSTER